jgi:hypothetical protein
MVVGVLLALLSGTVPETLSAARDFADGEQRAEHPYWSVASALHEMGVPPGAHVAVVHPPDTPRWSTMLAWARLGRFRIVAEVPSTSSEEYWNGTEAQQQAVATAFRQAGAVAMVACDISPAQFPSGWMRVTDSNCWFQPVRE